MSLSRRHLATLLPALAAASAAAQEKSTAVLPSKIYHHAQLPYEGNAAKRARRFFFGPNHSGFQFEMHETILGPETETHAPHKHEHEEVIIVVEGTAGTFLEGKTDIAETGSVIYFGSNQMHSIRNAGKTPVRYYVMELRGAGA